jgi:hypothetical protein
VSGAANYFAKLVIAASAATLLPSEARWHHIWGGNLTPKYISEHVLYRRCVQLQVLNNGFVLTPLGRSTCFQNANSRGLVDSPMLPGISLQTIKVICGKEPAKLFQPRAIELILANNFENSRATSKCVLG